MQQLAWSVTYVGWLVALGATWWLLRPVVAGVPRPVAPVPVRVQLHWLLLAAGPSALLLAVTHVLTIDTGPIPMLWVLPLALYLTSFVVAFSGRWPHEELAQWWPEWVAVALLLYLAAPFSLAWPAMLASFTALCLLAHGTLHHLRPEPGQLTHFYLVLAAGGAVGGVLVSLAAPLWFSRLTEYPIAVAVTGLALALSVGAPWTVWRRMLFVPGSRPALLLMLMLAFPVGWFALEPEGVLEESRSFYGLLRVDIVVDEDGERVRRLVSGHTVHGGVYVDRVAEPLHYYARGGPLHFAVEQRQTGPTHLGMIGLGTGAMAYWADADDRVSFYEIDAEGVRLAERWFPFLAQSDAEVSVQVGDGRLLVDADPNVDAQPLDVLLVDAFAGDAVPTHLLTVEAIRTYMAHMEHGGLVVFHISSNILDLSGVLDAVATELGLAIAFFPGEGWHPPRASYARSDVVVLAADTDRLAPFAEAGWLRTWEHPAAAVWTDDYIHPWQPLIARWLRGSK